MKMHRPFAAAAAVALAGLPLSVSAQTVDGTRAGDPYGSPLAVQTVQTGFGDNESELNAAYATVSGGRLYLMLTGNIQNNFNKLEIFIDSAAGGQGIFDSAGNDNAQNMDGLVFDAGFSADYHVIARRGDSKFDLDFADLAAQTSTGYTNVFGGADFGSGNTGTGVNAQPIGVGYNGSNTAGVTGGDQAADQTAAAAVETGLELSFDLADLGYAGGNINIMVGQNNQDHNYWSNQFLAGLQAPQGNLGGDGNGGFTGEGAIDFTQFAGNQYFTVVVPEPATAGLLAVGGLALLRRRR